MPWKEEITYTVDVGAGLGEVMHGISIRGYGLGTTDSKGQRGTMNTCTPCTHKYFHAHIHC